MALHQPFEPLKTQSRYQDVNPVPTSLVGDDLDTVPSRPVIGNSTFMCRCLPMMLIFIGAYF